MQAAQLHKQLHVMSQERSPDKPPAKAEPTMTGQLLSVTEQRMAGESCHSAQCAHVFGCQLS